MSTPHTRNRGSNWMQTPDTIDLSRQPIRQSLTRFYPARDHRDTPAMRVQTKAFAQARALKRASL